MSKKSSYIIRNGNILYIIISVFNSLAPPRLILQQVSIQWLVLQLTDDVDPRAGKNMPIKCCSAVPPQGWYHQSMNCLAELSEQHGNTQFNK